MTLLLILAAIGVTNFICAVPGLNYYFLDISEDENIDLTIFLPLRIVTPIKITKQNMWYFYVCQCPIVYISGMHVCGWFSLNLTVLEEFCSQLDLLAHRLKMITPRLGDEKIKKSLKRCINHHDQIYK